MAFKDKWRRTAKPFSLANLRQTNSCYDGKFRTKNYLIKNNLEMAAVLTDDQFFEIMDSGGSIHVEWLYKVGYIVPLNIVMEVGESVVINGIKYYLQVLDSGEYAFIDASGNQYGRAIKLRDRKLSEKEMQYMLQDQFADTILKTKE